MAFNTILKICNYTHYVSTVVKARDNGNKTFLFVEFIHETKTSEIKTST